MTSRFDEEWKRCWPWLQATLDYEGFLTPEAWYRIEVVAGRMALWVETDSAGITRIEETAHGRVCVIELIGGKAGTLERMLKDVERWAIAHQCRTVRFWGRRGWERLFPGRNGYTVDRVRLTKDLGQERT